MVRTKCGVLGNLTNILSALSGGLILYFSRTRRNHKYGFYLLLILISGCAFDGKENVMTKNNKIDYVELASKDMLATKEFFRETFGWEFKAWGDEYMDSHDGGIAIGFYKADLQSSYESGGALVTIFSEDLESIFVSVSDHGGQITKEIFPFPGGRRFHFKEPGGGNEFAVWSEK